MRFRFVLLFVFLFGIAYNSEVYGEINELVENLNPENTNSRYCIVVGSFLTMEQAKKFSQPIISKGYEVTYRKSESGNYRICLFDFSTAAEAKQKIKSLVETEAFIKQAWVLPYNSSSVKTVSKSEPVKKAAPVKNSIPATKPSATARTTSSVIPEVAKVTTTSKKATTVVVPEEKVFTNYCIVVAMLPTIEEAKEMGKTQQANGYNVFFRKNDDNTFSVCMYNLKTKIEAEKRLDKMQHIDGIFIKASVLGYNNTSDNLRFDQL